MTEWSTIFFSCLDASLSDIENESLEKFSQESENNENNNSVPHQNVDVMKWVTDSTFSTPLIADDAPMKYISSDTTLNKEELNTYTASEIPSEDSVGKCLSDVKPVIHTDQPVRLIYQQAIRHNIADVSSGEYALVPTSDNVAHGLIQYRPPYIAPYKCIFRPPTHLIPIQYIQHQPSEEVTNTPRGDNNITPVKMVPPTQQVVIPYIPNNYKSNVDGAYHVPVPIPVKTTKQKKPDTVKFSDVKKNDQPVISALVPNLPIDHPEKYMRTVNVELESQELWNEFHKLGTEMILTRAGR